MNNKNDSNSFSFTTEGFFFSNIAFLKKVIFAAQGASKLFVWNKLHLQHVSKMFLTTKEM